MKRILCSLRLHDLALFVAVLAYPAWLGGC